MKIVIGNILFAAMIVVWYQRYGTDRPVFISGAILAFIAFIVGTCMGWVLHGPAKHARPARGYAASQPTRSAAASSGAGRITLFQFLIRAVSALIALTCLLLCLAIAGAWFRGYTHQDTIFWNQQQWQLAIDSGRGTLTAALSTVADGHEPTWKTSQRFSHTSATPPEPPPTAVQAENIFLGFGYTSQISASGNVYAVQFPHWAVVVVTALVPLAWLTRARGRRRTMAADICRHCGHNLRTIPARCPECGAAVESR